MIRPSFASQLPSYIARAFSGTYTPLRAVILCALTLPPGSIAFGQVITVDTHSGNVSTGQGTVDRRYSQIKPTNVELSKTGLDPKTRLELIRVLEAEQGFAMRPFPRGHKGLTLEANGDLRPAGEAYLDMVTQFGICAKPGDGVVLTDIKFDHNKIIFQLNGGPDMRHRFLRHVQIGAGPTMSPVVQDNGDGSEPMGARLTLEFKGGVPELTGAQVKALLSPLISFDVKTPIQAFTDTLPPKLKEAIMNHDVWVGMSTDMVLFAKGAPERKVREVEGQTPFEEWIYGQPPKPVEFVRINGNRVIRVEIAKVGEAPEIFTKDEVEGLMRTDGSPLIAEQPHTRTVEMGDVHMDSDKQAAAPPPTLTAPGEKLPDTAQQNRAGAMKPVEFPKQKPDDYPDATNLPRDHKSADDADPQGKPAAPPASTATDASKSSQPNTTQPAGNAPATAAPGSTSPQQNPPSQQ